jgi:putative heme-binding domain-containing protein
MNNALKEAKATLTPAEVAALGDLTTVRSVVEAPVEVRPLVKEWKTSDLEPLLSMVGKGRNFARGQAAFAAAQCILCHRYGDQGGAAGPDLTNVATRFKRQDLLESMTEPSKVVSEQYQMTVFTMKDGSVTAGRISQENDDTVVVMTNPFDPSATTALHKPDVAARERSKVSLMPPGLLNTLNEEEILDLMAYLESMGDANHPNFKQ